MGQKKIIAGMDRGLIGTCIGERRRITIPPHLAYGKEGVDDKIPPDSTLVFYIKLLNIERVNYNELSLIGGFLVMCSVLLERNFS